MKHFRTTFVIMTTVLAVALLAPAASAKFTLHNSADMTETDVVNGSEYNTCGDHISGRSAWSYYQNLPTSDPLVSGAVSSASYEVFEFPANHLPSDFHSAFDANGNVIYVITDANGNIIESAPKVLTFTTAVRPLIPGGPVFQPFDEANPTDGLYLYSSVAFNEAVSPAAPVGSTLGIKPPGPSTLRLLNVVDCAPPPVVASVDAQPGLSVNVVNPASSKPTLVILVKGSATVDVTAIATAGVGGAAPVTTGLFGVLSKPADVNGDGRKDRLYFFRPNQTGLTCASTSVKIAGTLTGGTAWSGTDSVKPICV